jgi:hypothetical protein
MSEQSIENVIDELAAIAGAVGEIPEPFAPAILAFAAAAPVLGDAAVKGIGWLIHKIHHSKDPQAIAAKVLQAANPVADEYTDSDAIYGG